MLHYWNSWSATWQIRTNDLHKPVFNNVANDVFHTNSLLHFGIMKNRLPQIPTLFSLLPINSYFRACKLRKINHVSLHFEYLFNGQLDCLSKKKVVNSSELDFSKVVFSIYLKLRQICNILQWCTLVKVLRVSFSIL